MLPKSSVALGHSLRTDHGNSATPRNQGDQTTSRPTTDFSAVPCILAGVMGHLWFFSAVMAALSNSGMPLEWTTFASSMDPSTPMVINMAVIPPVCEENPGG